MKWYELDDKKLPSITSIASEIEPFFNEQYIVNGVLETTYNVISQIKGVASPDAVIELINKEFSINRNSALNIGTETHALVEEALTKPNKLIDTKNITQEELYNTATAWNSFMRVRNITFCYSELPVICDKFAGRLDIIANEHRNYMIMDIKTTTIKDDKVFLSRSHLLQLSMYFMCIQYIVKNNLWKYKVKDLKYDKEYEVDLTPYKDMFLQMLKRPRIALLYLDKANGKHAYFKFGRKEIFACKNHINAYLKYIKSAKRSMDITKRSRYVSLYKIPIVKYKGENYIRASLLKDYLRRQGLFIWQNNNSYFVFIGRHIKNYRIDNYKYFKEIDFWYIVDLLQNKKINKGNK